MVLFVWNTFCELFSMLALEHSQAVCVCVPASRLFSAQKAHTHTHLFWESCMQNQLLTVLECGISSYSVFFFFVVVSLCLIVNVQIWITDCCVLRPAPKIRSVATNRTTNLNQPVADRWLHVWYVVVYIVQKKERTKERLKEGRKKVRRKWKKEKITKRFMGWGR